MLNNLYTQPKQVLQALETREQTSTFPDETRLFIVLGHPRSDIGKGTLVAHLLRMLPDSNVIKFDGMLNSNLDNRYTAPDHDDFGIYTKYNAKRHWQPENHLLGGELLKNFVNEYGDTSEVLTFRPYLVKYFTSRVQERWRALGQPKNLVIELGGVAEDFEVDAYALPAIRRIKDKLGSNCQIILLTESSHNNQFIKTKPTRDAVGALNQRGLNPDIVLAREPHFEGPVELAVRLDFERRIREKLLECTDRSFSKVLSVPYFSAAEIDKYGDYLDKNLLPFIEPNRIYDKILLGTSNPNKIHDWQNELNPYLNTVTASEIELKLDVPEGLVGVRENSIGKAKAYCRASGLPAISDDVGFFINALQGQPGVALKRWGGELPDTTTNDELFAYLAKKIAHLDDTSAYFERAISIAFPNGDDYQFTYQSHGYIDKDLLAKGYHSSKFPLGEVFILDGKNTTWNQLTNEDRAELREPRTTKILSILKDRIALKKTTLVSSQAS